VSYQHPEAVFYGLDPEAACSEPVLCEGCSEPIDGEPGFSIDDHAFCDLVGPGGMTCADAARATLEEDWTSRDLAARAFFAEYDAIAARRAGRS